MKRVPSWQRRRHAFTLLELCVVAVIVGILLVLAFSVMGRVRRNVALVECTGNLREIYVAFINYVNDHRGFIPPPLGPQEDVYAGYDWNQYWWMPAYLGPYLIQRDIPRGGSKLTKEEARILNCPARPIENDEMWLMHSDPAISYVMIGPWSFAEYRFSNMPQKGSRLFLTEGRHSTVWDSVAYSAPSDARDSGRFLRRYHNGKLNLLFYDGHVEFFSGTDTELHRYLPPR